MIELKKELWQKKIRTRLKHADMRTCDLGGAADGFGALFRSHHVRRT